MIICAPEYLMVLSSLPIKFGPDWSRSLILGTTRTREDIHSSSSRTVYVEFNENKLELCVCVHGNKGVKNDVS